MILRYCFYYYMLIVIPKYKIVIYALRIKISMKCVLCEKDDFKILTNMVRYNIPRKVVQCTNCSLISLENPTSDVMDYSGSEYRSLYGPILGKKVSEKEMYDIQIKFQQERFDHVKSLVNHSSKVLEVGCSTGHFLYTVKEHVKEVVGIELDKSHAKFARENCNLNVYDRPINETSISDNYFDVIFMFQVLEHIPNPIEFLSEYKKYLKPNGIIYIEVPNINDSLLSIYDIPSYQKFYFRHPHVYYYSELTLQKILEKAGFNGTTKTIQEYTVFNHLHWLLTGNPQDTQIDGHQLPKLNCSTVEKKNAKISIKKWFFKINEEYKKLLEENNIAENISYQGNLI